MKSSARSFVFISSIFIAVLNGIAIWNYVNQKDKSMTHDTYKESKNSDGRKKEIAKNNEWRHKSSGSKDFSKMFYNRKNLIENPVGTNPRQDLHFKSRKLLNATTANSLKNYPKDMFTSEEKKSGYITFHIIGVCYMFLGLAIVCDEFFVPSLHVIAKILNISDDVAGATFMAAGGSAPELFVSIIGVFIAESNVGFGTIVGSAVFNVLFVIGMCAIFSKAILNLTWWPLLRDSVFYIIALIALICFFNNQFIDWWEALILFLIYIVYVIFMVYNSKTERFVKAYLSSNTRCFSSVTPMQLKPGFLSSPSMLKKDTFSNGVLQLAIHTLDPIAEDTVEEKFRQMRDNYTVATSDSINPGSDHDESSQCNDDGECDCGRCSTCSSVMRASSPSSPILGKGTEKNAVHVTENENTREEETQFQEPVKIEINCNNTDRNDNIMTNIHDDDDDDDDDDYETNLDHFQNNVNSIENKMAVNLPSPYSTGDIDLNNLQDSNDNDHDNDIDHVVDHDHDKSCESTNVVVCSNHGSRQFSRQSNRSCRSRSSCHSHRGLFLAAQRSMDEPDSEEIEDTPEEEEAEEPIDFSWPSGWGERLYYVIKLPLVIVFSITIPDVRRQKIWKLFPITFFMSIIWIAILTYLMAWWASEIGVVSGIPDEVMGLTFLAAGTSIPDLITSVVVARQGHGDMAVSSSIGSNIFDVTVGLPLPWLLKSLLNGREPVGVRSDGLFCSTILLFLMLISIDITIALNKWKMTKILGATMFGLYIVFITLTLLIQFHYLKCPL